MNVSYDPASVPEGTDAGLSAPVSELADEQDLGSCALRACGFKSHPAHFQKPVFSAVDRNPRKYGFLYRELDKMFFLDRFFPDTV